MGMGGGRRDLVGWRQVVCRPLRRGTTESEVRELFERDGHAVVQVRLRENAWREPKDSAVVEFVNEKSAWGAVERPPRGLRAELKAKYDKRKKKAPPTAERARGRGGESTSAHRGKGGEAGRGQAAKWGADRPAGVAGRQDHPHARVSAPPRQVGEFVPQRNEALPFPAAGQSSQDPKQLQQEADVQADVQKRYMDVLLQLEAARADITSTRHAEIKREGEVNRLQFELEQLKGQHKKQREAFLERLQKLEVENRKLKELLQKN